MDPKDLEIHARLQAANRKKTLSRIAADFASSINFPYYVIGLQVLRRGSEAQRLLVGNYPDEWANEYLDQGYACCDPVIEHALRSNQAILWSEVKPSTAEQRRVMKRAAGYGMTDGISVPLYLPRNVFGVMSFVRGEAIDAESGETLDLKRTCHWFAQLFANRLITIHEQADPLTHAKLTLREQEAVKYACDGLSVADIAKRMGISIATVRFFFAQAGRKLGAHGRSEIVAIANGSDLLNRHEIELRTSIARAAKDRRGRRSAQGGLPAKRRQEGY